MSEEISEETYAAVASELGMARDEIVKLEHVDEGGLITTKDGQVMIVVTEDRPDYEGKFGVMWWKPPTPSYNGTFPVYCHAAGVAREISIDLADAGAGDPSVGDAEAAEAIAAAAEARQALELEAIELEVEYEGVPDEELWLAVNEAKEAAAAKAVADREALLDEAVALGIKKPERMTADELLAAVLERRPKPTADAGDGDPTDPPVGDGGEPSDDDDSNGDSNDGGGGA